MAEKKKKRKKYAVLIKSKCKTLVKRVCLGRGCVSCASHDTLKLRKKKHLYNPKRTIKKIKKII